MRDYISFSARLFGSRKGVIKPPAMLVVACKYKRIDAKAYANLAKTHYDYYHHFEVTIGWTRIIELAKSDGQRGKGAGAFRQVVGKMP